MKSIYGMVLLGSLLCTTSLGYATEGITEHEVLIGMANAQSGPAAGLGLGVTAGSAAYINKVNVAGGIAGRKIKLLIADDGYEPARAAEATKKFIDQDKVFALFDYVGTPTSAAAFPYAVKASVPFIAPFTGVQFLRTPVHPLAFNIRASYGDEMEAQVAHLIGDLGIHKIALLMQDDGYGIAGQEGIKRALRKRGIPLLAEARYQRNTVDVAEALATLRQSNPEAVVMVGAYKACAAFVKQARASGFNPKFLNLSFVGTSNFISEAGADAEGVYITQVVPSPNETNIPIVRQYQNDMRSAGISNFDYSSLEGYINAVVLVEALKKAGTQLTRPTFLAALESLNIDIGGIDVQYSSLSHQALHSIYLTQVKSGKAVSIDKL